MGKRFFHRDPNTPEDDEFSAPEENFDDFSASAELSDDALTPLSEPFEPQDELPAQMSFEELSPERLGDSARERADDMYEDYGALDGAQELPALFPDEAQPAPEPQEPAASTRVPRPERQKRSTARKVLHVLAIVGKWLLALLLIVAILAGGLIGYLSVTEYTPAYAEVAQRGATDIQRTFPMGATEGSPAVQPEMTLRILTFNTGYGALGEDADFFMDGGDSVNPDSEAQVRENMLGIEDIIRSQNADIVLLQEVDTDSKRSFHQNQWLQYEYDLEDYETRYALNYSCNYVPYPLGERIGEVHSGIATYSRYNISSATRYSLPCPFRWPARVANLKRCMLVTRIPIANSDKEVVIVNLHLEAYDDGDGKIAQARQMMEFLEAEYAKGNYVIAGGDFNQVFPDTLDTYPIKGNSEWVPGTVEALSEDWQYAYDDTVPTCRLLNQPYRPSSSLTQYYVIDGFIVSPNVTITRAETLDEGFVYSDHNPVVLEVTLN